MLQPDRPSTMTHTFDYATEAELFDYSEETRIRALATLRTLTSSIQRSVGLFTVVPHRLQKTEVHLVQCY